MCTLYSWSIVQQSQLENIAGKFIPEDNIKVDTPLANCLLVSSITHLLDILGWCSQREAYGICQVKGKFIQ